MRYYQEVAANRVIEAILKGQRRILINPATGTGKTFIAFQTTWKLIKSGYFANRRVLFLADRVVLRSQAFNTFEPFIDPPPVPATGSLDGIAVSLYNIHDVLLT